MMYDFQDIRKHDMVLNAKQNVYSCKLVEYMKQNKKIILLDWRRKSWRSDSRALEEEEEEEEEANIWRC